MANPSSSRHSPATRSPPDCPPFWQSPGLRSPLDSNGPISGVYMATGASDDGGVPDSSSQRNEIPPERFELPTGRLEICCSIQLSYGGEIFGPISPCQIVSPIDDVTLRKYRWPKDDLQGLPIRTRISMVLRLSWSARARATPDALCAAAETTR